MSDLAAPFYRGDDYVIKHTVTTAAGAAQDLAGCTLKCTGKLVDGTTVWALTSSSGIAIDSPTTLGTAKSTIPASATSAFTVRTLVIWDLELTDGAGKKKTVDSGRKWVDLDVTP